MILWNDLIVDNNLQELDHLVLTFCISIKKP